MLYSELYVVKNDTIKFIYNPQKVYSETRDYSEGIDLSTEYNIDGTITSFRWYTYNLKRKKDEGPIAVQGEGGIFKAPSIDFTERSLRCKMYNAMFPDLGKKDSVIYEVIFTGVGIEELPNTNCIYPNPTNGKVTVQNVDSNIETIQVLDLTGKMVFETRQTTFDIAHLPTAIYVIQIKTDKGILTKKLMKK
jgi:hypothetical protein